MFADYISLLLQKPLKLTMSDTVHFHCSRTHLYSTIKCKF